MNCNNALTALEVLVHLARLVKQLLSSKIDSPLECYLEQSVYLSHQIILFSSAKTNRYMLYTCYVTREKSRLERPLLRISYSIQRITKQSFVKKLCRFLYVTFRAETLFVYSNNNNSSASNFILLKSHDSYPRPSIVVQWHYITEHYEPCISCQTFSGSYQTFHIFAVYFNCRVLIVSSWLEIGVLKFKIL